jgi:SPP1 gp7 family putative phage head morphogenesis protein
LNISRTTPAQKKRAAILDQQRERIAQIGISATARYGAVIRANAIQAFRRYKSERAVGDAIRKSLMPVGAVLAEGMATEYLQAVIRAQTRAAKVAGLKSIDELRLTRPLGVPTLRLDIAQVFDENAVYKNANEVMRGRLDLSPAATRQLAQSFSPMAVNVTEGLSESVERIALSAVATAIREMDTVDGAVSRLRAAFDVAGITTQKPWALESMYRTQSNVAYSAGQWQANLDPAIQDILWGYEYITIGDERVRPNHQALEGTRLPKDHPRWRAIYPPCGYGCRCSAIEIYTDDAALAKPYEPEGFEFEGTQFEPVPDDGWDFNPGEVFTPSTLAVR